MNLYDAPVNVERATPAVICWSKQNRSVKASRMIDHGQVGNWSFHDESHEYETVIRNAPFAAAADMATKSYCQQKGTKFARLYV